MQGPVYPKTVTKAGKGELRRFFFQRRWSVALFAVVTANVVYVGSTKVLITKISTVDLGFFETIHDTSFLLFSILPFSGSYFAKLEQAYPDSALPLLVAQCHGFIVFTSGLFLLLMVIRIRDLTRYVTEGKRRALKELSWSHYLNATRMFFMAAPWLAIVIATVALFPVAEPERVLDAALLNSFTIPMLVYYGLGAILLAWIGRRGRSSENSTE